MHYAYILENKEGRHYIGSCKNIEIRVKRHNQNSVRSTKHKGHWQLIYCEKFDSIGEARKKENQIKRYKKISYFLESA